MKILRVISSVGSEGGGPVNGLVNSSYILKDMGHQIEVVCLDDPASFDVLAMAFKTYAFGPVSGNYAYSKKISEWLNSNVHEYDVVVIHGLWQFHSYSAHRACVKNNVPYVVFTHGMLDPWFNKSFSKYIKKQAYWLVAERKVLRDAGRVLFTSQEEKEQASKSMRPYEVKPKVVAYGSKEPVSDNQLLSTKFYNNFPELEGRRFGLFLSRIHEKKGIDILIDGFKLSGISDYIIAIAGPDKAGLKVELSRKIEENGQTDRFVWLDMIRGDVKWGAFIEADFFVLPSHQENFGIVVAEALSTSTPVLITNKVNIWREIIDSGAGFVEEDDIDGVRLLFESWCRLKEDEVVEMKSNARQCYIDNFSLAAAASSLESTLFTVVKEHKGYSDV